MSQQAREEHQGIQALSSRLERVGRAIIGAGLQVHRELGPGLLESSYEHCLCYELAKEGLPFRRQVSLPLRYDGQDLDAGYRLDLLVDERVIVEVKSVEALSRLHEAQILTYLKLSGHRLGYLLNFNVPMFRQGIRRVVR